MGRDGWIRRSFFFKDKQKKTTPFPQRGKIISLMLPVTEKSVYLILLLLLIVILTTMAMSRRLWVSLVSSWVKVIYWLYCQNIVHILNEPSGLAVEK